MTNRDPVVTAERIVRASWLGHAAARAADRLSADAGRSRVATLYRALEHAWKTAPSVTRIRVGSTVSLLAIGSHAASLTALPLAARPLVPDYVLPFLAIAAATVFLLAGPLARGWPQSRVSRFLWRHLSTRP